MFCCSSCLRGISKVIAPLCFQQAGWFTPTVAILITFVLSSFAATMLCEAMQLIPGNKNFEKRYSTFYRKLQLILVSFHRDTRKNYLIIINAKRLDSMSSKNSSVTVCVCVCVGFLVSKSMFLCGCLLRFSDYQVYKQPPMSILLLVDTNLRRQCSITGDIGGTMSSRSSIPSACNS